MQWDFTECHSEEVISFFWRSVYYLSIHLSSYRSIYPSTVSIYLSINLSRSRSIYLSIYLYIYISIYLHVLYAMRHHFSCTDIFRGFWTRCGNLRGLKFVIFLMFFITINRHNWSGNFCEVWLVKFTKIKHTVKNNPVAYTVIIYLSICLSIHLLIYLSIYL